MKIQVSWNGTWCKLLKLPPFRGTGGPLSSGTKSKKLLDAKYRGSKLPRNFYVLLTVYLSISLDSDQLDAHLLYFKIRPLQSSTCFEHHMLIIRRLNCIDAASVIVLSISGGPVRRLRENFSTVLSQPMHRTATERTISDAASMQFNLLMMSM